MLKRLYIIITMIIGGAFMISCQKYSDKELSEKQIADIKTEIKETAIKHLHSKSAISSLSYYTNDATIISNGIQYSSFELFAEEIKKFYSTLSKINIATYNEIDINVITNGVALFTAKFRWSSMDTNGMTLDLHGVYSALYVCEDSQWKMSWRHESFEPLKK